MSLSIAGRILRESLEALSEIELQSWVVEPLLHAHGFDAVRDVSGPNEKGRDLVATKTELGTAHFYAIQVKKLKVSGRVEDPQSLMGLLYQLDQAIHEEAFDPATRAKRMPDRLIFITPFTISRATIDAALEKYRSLSRNQVTIIDGTTLASEVLRLIPHVAASFSDTLNYRLRVTSEYGVITESRSFGLSVPLILKEIFVEADYACFDDLVELLGDFLLDADEIQAGGRRRALRPPLSEEELRFLASRQAQWSRTPPPPPPLDFLRWHLKTTSPVPPVDLTIEEFMQSLIAHATKLLGLIDDSSSTDHEDTLDEIDQQIIALQAAVAEIRKTVILRQRSHLLSDDLRKSVADAYDALRLRRRLLTYSHLCRSNSVLLITGVAGAGKTTLLRTLVTKAAENDEQRDVAFAQATDIDEYTVQGILDQLLMEWNRMHKTKISAKAFRSKMANGGIRVMIDGLDEAGDRAQKLTFAIMDLTRTFALCPVAVTTRETVDISGWRSAIHLKLCPFNDNQIENFIGRWFSAKPSARDGLLSWLDQHPTMREVARTPLVVALMCSLYDVGEATMPLSETGLYERRLDFLLGRWEEAKTIPPMPEKARKRYMLLLMHFANTAHQRQSRFLPYPETIKLTTRFITAGFNSSGDSIIQDCLGRGLLVRDTNGLSLGHLVHQEFLVGMYLHKYNNVDDIQSHLGIDWWRMPLIFYASLIGDISALLRHLGTAQRNDHYWQLRSLVDVAGETPSDALIRL